ncbi:MAG: hypothetical protein WDN03_03740 [Rhizomicrobium sp.]
MTDHHQDGERDREARAERLSWTSPRLTRLGAIEAQGALNGANDDGNFGLDS